MTTLLKFYGKDLQDIDFEPWLEMKSEALHELARKWHSAIQNCGEDVSVIFHDNYPIGCVDDAPFSYVNVFTKHVNLGFFYGADLPDPTGLLQGSGKRMRHVKLKTELELDEKAISNILNHSYLDIKERLLMK